MRQTIVLLFFLLICAITIYIGEQDASYRVSDGQLFEHVQVRSQSFFTQFNLFMVNSVGPLLQIEGDEMIISHKAGDLFFLRPHGILYDQKEKRAFSYRAGRGLFLGISDVLELKDRVSFFDKEFYLRSSLLRYNFFSSNLAAYDQVAMKLKTTKQHSVVSVTADSLEGNLISKKFHFVDNVKGQIKRRRKYESSVNFSAEQMWFDGPAQVLSLQDQVNLALRNITAKADKGQIFLENYNKKLKYYVLKDDVRVKEVLKLHNGKVIKRQALAEQLDGILRNRQMVLTGFPKVIQSGSVLTGNKIVLYENRKVIEVQDANSNFRIERGN